MRVLELARYNIPEKIIESWISQICNGGFWIGEVTVLNLKRVLTRLQYQTPPLPVRIA